MSTENTDDHELFSQYSDSSDMDTADEQLLTPDCCTCRVPGPYRRAILETSDSGDESSHCSKSRESMPKKPIRLGPNFGPKRKFNGNKNPQIQSSNESRGESETLKVLGKTNGLLSKLLLIVLKKRSNAFEVLKRKWGAVATAALQNAAVLIFQEGRIDMCWNSK